MTRHSPPFQIRAVNQHNLAHTTPRERGATPPISVTYHRLSRNLDKRLQLEVRVDKLEKKVFGAHR